MARPRKAATDKRIHPVTFWLTDAEFRDLSAAAQSAQLRVNALARQFTLRGQHRLVICTTRRHDPAFIAQIRALGVNLNQLTMRSHLTGTVSPKVEMLCDEIRRAVLGAILDEGGE